MDYHELYGNDIYDQNDYYLVSIYDLWRVLRNIGDKYLSKEDTINLIYEKYKIWNPSKGQITRLIDQEIKRGFIREENNNKLRFKRTKEEIEEYEKEATELWAKVFNIQSDISDQIE